HEVLATVTGGLLDRGQIHRRLHHAQQLAVAAAAGADRAQRLLAEVAAAPAVPDALHRLAQRIGQLQPALAIPLQQMERHPLRTLAAHAGQAAQRFDEGSEEWRAGHRRTLKSTSTSFPRKRESIGPILRDEE